MNASQYTQPRGRDCVSAGVAISKQASPPSVGDSVKVFSKTSGSWHSGRVCPSEKEGLVTIAFGLNGYFAVKHLEHDFGPFEVTPPIDAPHASMMQIRYNYR